TGPGEPELAALDEPIDDDLLRLIFTATHPALPATSRTALTLKVLAGLQIAEIARAFLISESTAAQRVVRAKRTLLEQRIRLELPAPAERTERLAAVLEVIYLIFNEGYAATAGQDLMRPALCDEALRLGRVLAELAPGEPEALGLLALMELTAARAAARTDAAGEPVLLLAQNRALWDQLLLRRGLAALARAEALGRAPGPFGVQAAIAACHARARTAGETDWAGIAALYAELGALTPSPVVALNRALAVAMAEGPQAGLDLLDAIAASPALAGYHLLPSARAELLARLGRREEARAEFERAAALTRNTRQRDRLLERAAQLARGA
ncbi:MAG TPA: DUF6596 domain-containing protein, partial [Polyangia bacterium]|nr:DUF6596 domain-containing protein [Polyangia bacterium]